MKFLAANWPKSCHSQHSVIHYIQAQQEEGKKYILKNLEYDPVHRLDLFLLPCPDGELEGYLKKLRRDGNAIESARPWQLQGGPTEFNTGN